MDVINSLVERVRQQVMEYAGPAIRATSYFVANEETDLYAVIDVPDHPRPFRSNVVLMVRVIADVVIIEEDINDRPLWQELVRVGIPREKIILAYAGETLPQTE